MWSTLTWRNIQAFWNSNFIFNQKLCTHTGASLKYFISLTFCSTWPNLITKATYFLSMYKNRARQRKLLLSRLQFFPVVNDRNVGWRELDFFRASPRREDHKEAIGWKPFLHCWHDKTTLALVFKIKATLAFWHKIADSNCLSHSLCGHVAPIDVCTVGMLRHSRESANLW